MVFCLQLVFHFNELSHYIYDDDDDDDDNDDDDNDDDNDDCDDDNDFPVLAFLLFQV